MRIFLSTLAVIVAAALTPLAVSAQDYKASLVTENTLTIGTSGSAPPFTMVDASGTLSGFDIDVANLLGKELGLEIKFETLEFAGLLPGLATGRFDMIASGVIRSPERLASTDFFLLSPYIVNGAAVSRRVGDDDIIGWASVCGKVMGAVRGGTFQKIAIANLPEGCVTEMREYPSPTEMYLDLTNRRIDFAAHDLLGPNYLLKNGSITDVVVLNDLLATVTQSVAVNKNNKALADRIDAQFAIWREDGTLTDLITKWFGVAIDWSAAK